MTTRLVLVLALALVACNPAPKEAAKAEPGASVGPSAPASPSPSPSTTTPSGDRRVRIVAAAQDSDALSAIRTERLKAKADGRVLVVYVSATWCEPCKKLKEEIEAGRLDERFGTTTLLAFDADKDLDRLGAAGYTFKFVPYVALPGPDGRAADAQEATGKGKDAWKELLGKLDTWQRQPR